MLYFKEIAWKGLSIVVMLKMHFNWSFLCFSGILGHNSTSCFAKLFSLTSFPFLVFFVAKRTRRSLFLLAFFLRNLSKMFHNLVLVIDASPKKNLGKMRKFRPLHFSLLLSQIFCSSFIQFTFISCLEKKSYQDLISGKGKSCWNRKLEF